jgi:DNA-binding NtrC family response regulator
MKIILVDDEKKFVNMLAKRLSLRGINADVACSGKEALKKVTQTSYDLAVLDLKMPGISGFALKKELMDMRPDMKFIFVTGHGAIDKNGNNNNSDDLLLAKPLNIETLIETINQKINHNNEKRPE